MERELKRNVLIFLNKKIRNNPIRKALLKWEEEKECAYCLGGPAHHRRQILFGNSTGQVAIILILICAIALIFFVVAFNLGRLSQTKTQTTIAANAGASQMASLAASYGQSLFMGQLGGKTRDCGFSSFFTAIVDFIVGIIIGAIKGGWVGAIIAAIQGAANIYLQVTYVERFYQNLWGQIMSESLSMRDGFLEQGISTALQTAVSDRGKVPDLHDFDGDRIWGYDVTGHPKDYVGRFGFYYNERLKTISALDTVAIEKFVHAMQDMLYFISGTDPWAFFDDTLPAACEYEHGGPSVPSVCNPCCVPNDARNPIGGADKVDYRPSCCDNGKDDECGKSADCTGFSPYEKINANSTYQYVYDPYLENWENNDQGKISFREALGRDDEHQYYEEVPPNFYSNPPLNFSGIEQNRESGPINFYLNDTSDYLDADKRGGSFPFFYKIADWGVDLTVVDPPVDYANHPDYCYWNDSTACNVIHFPEQERESNRLSLPVPPSHLTFNYTNFVDNINTPKAPVVCVGLDCPALAPDKIILPNTILAADNACAENFLDSGYTGGGFWKRGGDQFCSPGDDPAHPNPTNGLPWPYSSWCAKHGSGCKSGVYDIQCPCGDPKAGDETLWPDDTLDDMIYEIIPGLVELEKMLGKKDFQILAQSFADWYGDVARWIEPAGGVPNQVCFTCPAQEGILWVWKDVITAIKNRLTAWKDTAYAGTNCDEVWCVPPGQGSPNEYGINECPGVSVDEATTFGTAASRGDMEHIIACLEWNISDDVFGVQGVQGNAEKFRRCHNECVTAVGPPIDTAAQQRADAICSQLPRTLVPEFDPAAYKPYGGVNPSCEDSTFRANVDQSALEAENQVAKFKTRKAFLEGRLVELNSLGTLFDNAETQLNNFLTCGTEPDDHDDGPACALIKARIALSNQALGLPYQAIYVWQDEPPGKGYWHAVRVDGRLSGKCDSACGPDQKQTGHDDPWPTIIRVDQPGFWGDINVRDCFVLDHEDGVVKMRVTRFDEERDASSLKFPAGLPIWNFKSNHPSRPADAGSSIADDIKNYCDDEFMVDGPLGHEDIYKGAFILNSYDPQHPDCWNQMNKHLSRGITSETCAKYYFHEGDKMGFGFKFVPCKEF